MTSTSDASDLRFSRFGVFRAWGSCGVEGLGLGLGIEGLFEVQGLGFRAWGSFGVKGLGLGLGI